MPNPANINTISAKSVTDILNTCADNANSQQLDAGKRPSNLTLKPKKKRVYKKKATKAKLIDDELNADF